MSVDPLISPAEIKEEMLKAYPAKVGRKRAKQIVINEVAEDDSVPEIQANVRTIPGIITQRGCCYAGCKGVVLGSVAGFDGLLHPVFVSTGSRLRVFCRYPS